MIDLSRPARRLADRADGAMLRLPDLPMPAFFDRASTNSTMWIWITTRLLMLTAVGFAEESVVGDVAYYGRSLSGLFHGVSVGETMQEYPLPVLGVMLPQFVLGGFNPLAFALLFIVSMLAVDAAFTRVLVRARRSADPDGPPGARGAVGFWLWFLPLMGPLAYFRFDLVPAVFAGSAILTAAARPARSGLLTALGAALKLWPAALLPTFLIRGTDRRAVLKGFLVSGGVIVGLTVLVGGISRMISPLRWQAARGLQIESVFALPLMIARAFHPQGVWSVRVSRYKAWEIFGAGSHALLTVSTVATVGGAILLIALWYRAYRLPLMSMDVLGWLVFVTVALMTVINKTLSPQYVLWLGGPLAVMMVGSARDPVVRRAAASLLTAAGLTQLIFPLTYGWLLGHSWTLGLGVTILGMRDALLVWLTWTSCRHLWRLTAPAAATIDLAADAGASEDELTAGSQSLSSTA